MLTRVTYRYPQFHSVMFRFRFQKQVGRNGNVAITSEIDLFIICGELLSPKISELWQLLSTGGSIYFQTFCFFLNGAVVIGYWQVLCCLNFVVVTSIFLVLFTKQSSASWWTNATGWQVRHPGPSSDETQWRAWTIVRRKKIFQRFGPNIVLELAISSEIRTVRWAVSRRNVTSFERQNHVTESKKAKRWRWIRRIPFDEIFLIFF